MKMCNKCKEVKEIEDYYKNNRTPDGYSRRCKECEKEYHRDKQKQGDGFWSLYYLPSENYYGHTHNVKSRMRMHRVKGKDTSNYIIIKTSENKSDVLFYEKLNQKKLKPIKQKKLIQVYKNNKLLFLSKTLHAASQKTNVTKERVRQLINTGKETRTGYTFYKR